MTNPIFETPDFKWAEYKLWRSNALWFCRQLPATISHPSRPSEDISCTIKDLKQNTESWLTRTLQYWQILQSVPVAEARHISEKSADNGITTAQNATAAGVHKCYCPACLIAEMKATHNPNLKVEYPV